MILATRPTLTVGVGDMAVALDPDVIATYSLGSCVGLTMYDPTSRVGGMLHAQLPNSKTNPEKAANNPALFVDTGFVALLTALFSRGARKDRLVTKLAGGASMLGDRELFQIGEKNLMVIRKLLWKNGILLQGEETGGDVSRTIVLDLGTGITTLKSAGETREL
jgi:chemotaxis protein CheD